MTKLSELRTGDILAWKHDRRNKMSDLFIRVIKLATGGQFGHVGIVIKILHWTFVLEASLPMVRLSRVRPEEEIYYIPLPGRPEQNIIDFFMSLIGLNYGIIDALRAVFGKVSKKDDKWQCAEIVIEFCAMMGYELPTCEYTPDAVVQMLCDHFCVTPQLLEE